MQTPDLGGPAKQSQLCSLCLQSKALCRSHILPESCYRPSYDAKNRAFESSSLSPYWRVCQKGKRQPLLCEHCDNVVINRYEKYFKEFWFDKPALPNIVKSDSVQVCGIDYSLFKLFHLSVLWRAGASSLPEFANVNLGHHAEKLRKMLYAGDAGPDEAYAVFGSIIVLEAGEVAYDLVAGPFRLRKGPFTAYCMCYAGCEWYFIVNQRCSAEYQMLAIKKGSPFVLGVKPLKKAYSFMKCAIGLAASRGRREASRP